MKVHNIQSEIIDERQKFSTTIIILTTNLIQEKDNFTLNKLTLRK